MKIKKIPVSRHKYTIELSGEEASELRKLVGFVSVGSYGELNWGENTPRVNVEILRGVVSELYVGLEE